MTFLFVLRRLRQFWREATDDRIVVEQLKAIYKISNEAAKQGKA